MFTRFYQLPSLLISQIASFMIIALINSFYILMFSKETRTYQFLS